MSTQDLWSESFIKHTGYTDIYLLDAILKGVFDESKKVLDCGCGGGRNLHTFLNQSLEVYGVDHNEDTITYTKEWVKLKHGSLAASRIHVGRAEEITQTFQSNSIDAIISIAVLHFTRDAQHWREMMDAMWNVLRPGGVFFARLAVTTGVETLLAHDKAGLYTLPGGQDWYLSSIASLDQFREEKGATSVLPFKTALVPGERSMGVWILRKAG